MANWNTLKTAVADIINANGNQAITGQLLQNALNNIITNVGENATFAGIATVDTNPGAPDGPVFYLATTAGIYPNFNGIEVLDGEAVILEWGNSTWTKKVTGFATQEKLSELGSKKSIYIELPDAQMGVFATASGNPPKKSMSTSVSNSQCIDITDVNTNLHGIKTFYLKAKRVSSAYKGVVAFYSDNFLVNSITSDEDEYVGIITIPDNVDEICINSVIGYSIEFFPIYPNEIKTIKDSLYSVFKATPLSSVKDGYVTASGNPSKIVISKQTDSIYSEFNLPELTLDKIYVSTRRLSSSLSGVVVFSTSDNIYISSINADNDYVIRKEVTVPNGATKMYVNGRVGYDIIVEYEINVTESLLNLSKPKEKNIDNVISQIDKSISDNLKGIKAIRFYSPIPYVASSITEIGYNNLDNKFHIVINGMEGVKDYTTRPVGAYAKNHDTISFILNPPSNDIKFYYVEVDIDWVKYNQASAEYVDISSYPISIQPLHIDTLNHIKNVIDLYSTQVIPIDYSLKGKGCTINVHNTNVGFTLSSNVCIDGVIFTDVTENAITREVFTEVEIEEKPLRSYLLKPLISEADLASEDSEMLNGENSYGLLRFKSTAVNPSITNCTFNNFNRTVINGSTTRHEDIYHNVVANNMFNCCRTGYYCNSEFTRIYGNYFYGCIFGIVVNCSNFNSVDCMFVRCDCGMYFTSKQNSHGEISTFEFAHNNVAGVYAKIITNNCGFIFSNSQFAQAPIIAEKAYGLKLSSCRIDSWVKILQGAKNSIIGCNCGMNYVTDDGVEKIFDVPEDTLLALNRAYKSNDDDSNYN